MAFTGSNINESNLGSELAAKVNRVVINYAIGTVENGVIPIDIHLPSGVQFDTIYHKTASGTCTINVRIDEVSIGGWSALSATSTKASASASGSNTATAGQSLDIEISSNASAENLALTIVGQEV